CCFQFFLSFCTSTLTMNLSKARLLIWGWIGARKLFQEFPGGIFYITKTTINFVRSVLSLSFLEILLMFTTCYQFFLDKKHFVQHFLCPGNRTTSQHTYLISDSSQKI